MTTFALPDDAHALIRDAYHYWLRIRPDTERLPGRQHVEPTAIPKLLSHIWMIDVEDSTAENGLLRFRYRLLGTGIRRVLPNGNTVVGRWLDEVDENFHNSGRAEIFAQPVRTHQPSYRRGLPQFPLGLDHLTIERIFLPLAADGRHVDMLFCISLFLSSSNRLMDPGE